MLFLEFSEGQPFEEYVKVLPNSLRDDFLKIGFHGLDEDQVLKVCKLSEELVELALTIG